MPAGRRPSAGPCLRGSVRGPPWRWRGRPSATPTPWPSATTTSPNIVSWALAREARADDTRMLELLAPFAGHRGRVVRLLGADGHRAPKFGPRQAILPIAIL